MAKTYTLTSVSINGGWHYNWTNANWTGIGDLSNGCTAQGTEGASCTYTNILFYPSELAALSGKNITSILLQFTCETNPPAGGNVSCCLKANGNARVTGNGNSWQRLTAYAPRYNNANATTLSGTRRQMNMTPGGLPTYGYVFGPNSPTVASTYTLFDAFNNPALDAATLIVTTDETDYALSYDANGGTGAPSLQTGTGVGSYTFTLSSAAPTRAGYVFLGWATSASALSAAHQPGDTVVVTADTTLYAVWRKTASIYIGATAGEPVIGGVTGTAYLAANGQLREGNGIW